MEYKFKQVHFIQYKSKEPTKLNAMGLLSQVMGLKGQCH